MTKRESLVTAVVFLLQSFAHAEQVLDPYGYTADQWEEQNRFRVCPLLQDVAYPCEAGQYWNELACECFTVSVCYMMCGDDEDFHPLKQCECENIDVIKQEVYPDWASQQDIENAENFGLETYWPEPEPEEWPQCNPTPMCSEDYYFNALSCTCWPQVDYCVVGCSAGEERDPRVEGCGCISEDEFNGLFPEWASDWEIQESMLGQWREPDPCPEPWLEVPSDWPQCPPTDECDSADVNLLACECFARFTCYNYCGNDEVHDPIGGCECIPREEYELYFPDWATEYDIALSEMLFWL